MNNYMGKYTIEEIFDVFNGFPEIEDEKVKRYLVTSISYIDEEIIDLIEEKVVIISADKTIYGMYINHLSRRYKSKDFIFLNISRFRNEKKIISIILHEIAHFYYRHKCYQYDYKDSDLYEKYENQADELAKKWYKDYIKTRK